MPACRARWVLPVRRPAVARPYADRVTPTPLTWLKGHGTENDFLVVPDPDGAADLDSTAVAAMCHRRSGIGADGVLRVVRSTALDDPAAKAAAADGVEWFMDYRNADGSLSEMCGNGIRVLVRYLLRAGLVDDAAPVAIGTRGGTRLVTVGHDGRIGVDMGPAQVQGATPVTVEGRRHDAVKVSVGNPHAVVFVDELAAAGSLLQPPGHDPLDFPDGVNVEFVVPTGDRAIAMRVHERGSGETRSCGTGACAAAVAFAEATGVDRPASIDVGVPGGALEVRFRPDGGVDLVGPAVLVAEGSWPLA
jgi:diaminopimelate epimerase